MAQVEPYSWGDVPTSSGGATRDLPAWMPQPPPQTGAGGAGTFVPPPCFPPVTTPPDIDVDRIRISEGYYAPGFLGPTPAGDVINPGVNFAIHSAAAAGIDLLIYFDPSSTSKQPSLRIPLDPKKNKTGDVWHVRLDNIPRGGDGYVIRYGYLVDGESILIIARAISLTSCSFGYFWLFLVIFGNSHMGNSYDVVFSFYRWEIAGPMGLLGAEPAHGGPVRAAGGGPAGVRQERIVSQRRGWGVDGCVRAGRDAVRLERRRTPEHSAAGECLLVRDAHSNTQLPPNYHPNH